jgi:hypothetical protein
MSQDHNDREDHRRRTDYGSSDKNWFCGGLKGITRAIVGLQIMLGFFKIWCKSVFFFDLFFDIALFLDKGKLIN